MALTGRHIGGISTITTTSTNKEPRTSYSNFRPVLQIWVQNQDQNDIKRHSRHYQGLASLFQAQKVALRRIFVFTFTVGFSCAWRSRRGQCTGPRFGSERGPKFSNFDSPVLQTCNSSTMPSLPPPKTTIRSLMATARWPCLGLGEGPVALPTFFHLRMGDAISSRSILPSF